MSTALYARLSPEEYLQKERQAEFRSEYINGEVFAKAGGTSDHNLIIGNSYNILRQGLRGKSCFVYTSEMKVWIPSWNEFAYPDVVAVCGERQFRDATQDVLLNPTLIIEVLSKSTANHDRSEKFLKYQAISSFREYLLIAQDQWRVERFCQTGHRQWTLDIHTEPSETVLLESVETTCCLTDFYENVRLP